jgi:RNA polymerase sigma factor (sigma-70 family)
MKRSERLKLFEKLRQEYFAFLTSVLWKLTGDRELFAEAVQYALLGIWQHVEKLNSKKAAGYIYKIALSANSLAWRNRIANNGHSHLIKMNVDSDPSRQLDESELKIEILKAVSQLPSKQSKAIVMRYFEQENYDKIAAHLNCSQAGARSHVSKAINSLRTKLANVISQEQENG